MSFEELCPNIRLVLATKEEVSQFNIEMLNFIAKTTKELNLSPVIIASPLDGYANRLYVLSNNKSGVPDPMDSLHIFSIQFYEWASKREDFNEEIHGFLPIYHNETNLINKKRVVFYYVSEDSTLYRLEY